MRLNIFRHVRACRQWYTLLYSVHTQTHGIRTRHYTDTIRCLYLCAVRGSVGMDLSESSAIYMLPIQMRRLISTSARVRSPKFPSNGVSVCVYV